MRSVHLRPARPPEPIHGNGGVDIDGLGVDLNGEGLQDGDSDDSDSGSNMLTIYPLTASAASVGGTLQVIACFGGRTGSPSDAPFTFELCCTEASR